MKNFLAFASICCLITVFTTILIHLVPYQELSFDERALLYKDHSYRNQRLMIMAHCFFFLMAMWGVFLVLRKKGITYSGLGMLFFGIFSLTEIIRQLLILFHLNGLKEKYVEATNPTIIEIVKVSIENFGFTNYTLYTIFIIAFGLGAIFYGLELLKFQKAPYHKWLAILMLIWGIGSFLAFGNVFWNLDWLGKIIEPYNLYYQAFMRLVIALWLLINYLNVKKPKLLEN